MGISKSTPPSPPRPPPGGGGGRPGGGSAAMDKFKASQGGGGKQSIGAAFAQREAQTAGRVANMNLVADQAAARGNTEGAAYIADKISKMPKF